MSVSSHPVAAHAAPAAPGPDVVVAGAGCCGLAVALQLLRRGQRRVTILTKDTTPRTTSDQAGALWRPFGEVSLANQATFTRWGKQTFDFLNSLRQEHGSAATGILLVSGFEVFPSLQSMPFWAGDVLNFRMLDGPALRALGIQGYEHGFSYTSIIIDMNIYMQWMHREIHRLGGVLRFHELKSLSEVQDLFPSAKLLVNCTGLGAAPLVKDAALFPVAGHIVKARLPGLHHFFMDSENATYIFPRIHDAIVGGTYLKRDGSERPSIANRVDIIARAAKFVPEVATAEIVGEYVGLRPYRDVTRLELEMPDTATSAAAGKGAAVRLPVIHNYGHGGSGVTLHWGCAVDVCELAAKFLPQAEANRNIASKL